MSQKSQLKIAIACSGLGVISRGVETWAADLARALHRNSANVSLFQGGNDTNPTDADWQYVLPCARRLDPRLAKTVKLFQKIGGWRYGFGSGYQIEQTTFALNLFPRIRKEYDIVHVQDPWIAYMMERLHRMGLSRPRAILANGTEEPTEFLQKLSYLQHLAPNYLEDWKSQQPAGQQAFAIPNFVKTEQFRPATMNERREARKQWEIPEDHLVVLSVAALKKTHKRVDLLIREFDDFSKLYPGKTTLVVAGAREPDTNEILALGREKLGDRVKFLESLKRDRVLSLYHMADIFALASSHEMMPIALLEALSCGLPVACNNTATMLWMAKPAGPLCNIDSEGGLSGQLRALSDPEIRKVYSTRAREHAIANFSEPVVLNQIVAMYEDVCKNPIAQSKKSKSMESAR